MIDNESKGKKDESYAIGNVTMNFLASGGSPELKTLEDVSLYDNKFAQGAQQKVYSDFKNLSSWNQNKKFALGAAVNAIAFAHNLTGLGFKDYSEKATGWDGIDLIDTKYSNDHRFKTWSSASQDILQQYKDNNNGGYDIGRFTYKDSGFQMSANAIIGKSLFEKIYTPRGEKKQDTTMFR